MLVGSMMGLWALLSRLGRFVIGVVWFEISRCLFVVFFLVFFYNKDYYNLDKDQ